MMPIGYLHAPAQRFRVLNDLLDMLVRMARPQRRSSNGRKSPSPSIDTDFGPPVNRDQDARVWRRAIAGAAEGPAICYPDKLAVSRLTLMSTATERP